MPRLLGRQRWRIITLMVLLVYLAYTFIPPLKPPDWQNNNSITRPPPNSQRQARGEFLFHSRFRTQPDTELEAQLEAALIRIEKATRPLNGRVVKKIWQIWLNNKLSNVRETDSLPWIENNPGWEYTVSAVEQPYTALSRLGAYYGVPRSTDCRVSQLVTDTLADDFIHSTLHTVPSLSQIWHNYPLSVLRADLLRYLLLWYYGGFYADIDVTPLVPISACSPLSHLFSSADAADDSYTPNNVSLVVGVEIDEPYASPAMKKAWHWSRSYGFCQWTLFAPRRFSPVLRKVIVRALAHSSRHNEVDGRWWRRVRYTEHDILETTGPGMFTDALLDAMSESLPESHPLMQISSNAVSEEPVEEQRD